MIRKAAIQDIKAIYQILHTYGNKGELLPRPLRDLYDHVRDFSVYVHPQTHDSPHDIPQNILGCCALQICWEDLAEIRSLAVHPNHVHNGIGTLLVQKAIEEAMQFQIKKIFVLTYQPDYFRKFGFTPIDKAELPLKIWADCMLCVKFPDCDETAMIREIRY
jgi:amino-acid N-acetyltransferase